MSHSSGLCFCYKALDALSPLACLAVSISAADSVCACHQRTPEVLRQRVVESLAHDEGESSCSF